MRSTSSRDSISRRLDKVTRTHLIVEAMRRVHRDRAVYLGDPDFVSVPVARLINPNYAAGQRASIRMDRATPSAMLPGVRRAVARARRPRISRCSTRTATWSRRPSRSISSSARASWFRAPASCSTTRWTTSRRSPACRTAFSSSAPTRMRSRRRSGRCPRRRPRSSRVRTG